MSHRQNREDQAVIGVSPKFYKHLNDVTCEPRMCTVLECRVRGSPPPKVIWKREGEVIKDSIDFRMLQKGEVCTLVVGDVYPEDAGVFTCEAFNGYGSDVSSARLIVKGQSNIHSISTHVSANRAFHPSGPRTVKKKNTSGYILGAKYGGDNHNFKNEKNALVQDMAKRIASPRPNEKAEIVDRDYVVATPLPPQEQEEEEAQPPQVYKVSQFEQKLMSEIEYRLEQTPPVIEIPEDNIYEDVESGKEFQPIFTSPLKNYKALRGTAATFTCAVDGAPIPKVFWFKDGKQISKRSQHYVQSSDGNNHSLSIEMLGNEDDGNYTALAITPLGKKTSTGRLVVATSLKPDPAAPIPNGISRRTHVPVRGELAPDEESPVDKVYRPSFYQRPPPQMEGDESKVLRFDVKVTGLPTPVIEWRFNGNPVRSDARHKILVRENNIHSLLFERLSLADQGTYEVVAKNRAGNNTAEIYLTVKPKEQIIAPQFIQRLQPTQVLVGDSVRLEVRVTAQPMAKITWKKGNLQINHTAQTQLYTDESGYSCLQIAKAELKDAAWYTVSAGNKAGIASCNCKLDVFAPVVQQRSNRRKMQTPHRYAQLAKNSGVDMTASLITDSKLAELEALPESDDL